MDKWGGCGGARDSDGWGGRGNRPSPWRGNGNRRRNDDWETSNQKRWRRDDNPEWDDQKHWKRGPIEDDEEWKPVVLGPQWGQGVKKDEDNFVNLRNRETNEERHRKPSKWGDKESENKVKEDWNRKSVERRLSNDESNTEEGPHRTSAPMDLDNYDGESVGNIEQLHGAEEQDTSNLDIETRQHELKNEHYHDSVKKTHDLSNFNNTKPYVKTKEDDIEHYNEHKKFEDYHHNDFSNSPQELIPSNIEEMQHQDSNYDQQNVEHNDSDYQKDSRANFNCENEYEIVENNREFEQNQYSESNYDSVKYENEHSNYDQSYDNELSRSSNNQDTNSSKNDMIHADEPIEEKHREENSEESERNLYFASDSLDQSSINKSVVTEQHSNENPNTEGTGMASPDNNDDAHAEESI